MSRQRLLCILLLALLSILLSAHRYCYLLCSTYPVDCSTPLFLLRSNIDSFLTCKLLRVLLSTHRRRTAKTICGAELSSVGYPEYSMVPRSTEHWGLQYSECGVIRSMYLDILFVIGCLWCLSQRDSLFSMNPSTVFGTID
jgi:hypothetical protein